MQDERDEFDAAAVVAATIEAERIRQELAELR